MIKYVSESFWESLWSFKTILRIGFTEFLITLIKTRTFAAAMLWKSVTLNA